MKPHVHNSSDDDMFPEDILSFKDAEKASMLRPFAALPRSSLNSEQNAVGVSKAAEVASSK